MFGKLLVYLIFSFSAISTVVYFYSINKKGLLKIARIFYYLLTAGMIFVSGYLLKNILDHNFQITYIWQYSSLELPLNLLISSFYAGQEGSFTLWALFISVIGLFLIPYAKKHNYESLIMGFYSFIMVFLTLILIVKSPFSYIWDSFPKQNIAHTFMPENGRGLNPILENYWMTIHPPILFMGYSAMSVPFVFAMAGLLKRDYQSWIKISFPWTIFACAMLGLGISLGGFWSYETLGWGGFWAWDPVENSSFMPWLMSIALIHTMIVQKRTGGLVITNFLFSILVFILVLYATFLTRSGVLGDTSVHSFVDPGQIVYFLLLLFLFFFLVAGLVILMFRVGDIKSSRISFNISSREFILSVGSLIILAMTVIVFVGTSWPIFSELLGRPKVAIEIDFYNDLNLPLAILSLILTGIAIFLRWKTTDWNIILKEIWVAAVISLTISIIFMIFTLHYLWLFLLLFASLFAMILNFRYLLKVLKRPSSMGAYLTHMGFALLMIGVIGSGSFDRSVNMSLIQDQTKSAFGYDFTYIGKKRVEKEKKDREKYNYLIEIKKGNSKAIAEPVMYWSDFNNREAPFLQPGIDNSWLKDIYITPRTVNEFTDVPSLTLSKNQSNKCPLDSTINITMLEFDMSRVMNRDDSKEAMLGTILQFTTADTSFVDTVISNLDMQKGEFLPQWYSIPGKNIEIGFVNLIRNNQSLELSQSELAFREKGQLLPKPVEILNVEISEKPLIGFVWLGVIFMVTGFFVAMSKRIKKLKMEN